MTVSCSRGHTHWHIIVVAPPGAGWHFKEDITLKFKDLEFVQLKCDQNQPAWWSWWLYKSFAVAGFIAGLAIHTGCSKQLNKIVLNPWLCQSLVQGGILSSGWTSATRFTATTVGGNKVTGKVLGTTGAMDCLRHQVHSREMSTSWLNKCSAKQYIVEQLSFLL